MPKTQTPKELFNKPATATRQASRRQPQKAKRKTHTHTIGTSRLNTSPDRSQAWSVPVHQHRGSLHLQAQFMFLRIGGPFRASSYCGLHASVSETPKSWGSGLYASRSQDSKFGASALKVQGLRCSVIQGFRFSVWCFFTLY